MGFESGGSRGEEVEGRRRVERGKGETAGRCRREAGESSHSSGEERRGGRGLAVALAGRFD